MRTIRNTALALALSIAPATALAKGPGHLVVSGDFERGPSAHVDGHAPVVGTGVRVGYGIDAAILELVPEARLMVYGEPDQRYGTAELGGRVMFLKVLEPGLFARAVVPVGGGGPGTGLHVGGLLDFTAIPVLDVGVHAGLLMGVKGTSALGGAHVTLNF